MRDATVERLAKLITDNTPRRPGGKGSGVWRPGEIHFSPAEGWLSLILLALIVFSTIWSVQAARWVDNLNILSLTTLIGLLCGIAAAKQQFLSRAVVHCLCTLCGVLLAFWQTAGAFYQGSTMALLHGLNRWTLLVLSGGNSDDSSVFLLLILFLGFALAYTSAWLVYRTRSPWLMITANALVLLINLSNLDAGYIVFLVIFLVASLLFLLRFNLYESLRRWRRLGLRYADDIGWDIMQVGALVSIAILIVAWLLPWGYTDPTAAKLWSNNANPWMQLQNTWNRVIAFDGTSNPSNHGNFRDTLVLGGNPNLNNEVVFHVRTDGDGSQYLQFLSYDTYTEHGWVVSPVDKINVKANQLVPSNDSLTHTEKQTIEVVNPPGEEYPYISGASEITSTSLPSNILFSSATGGFVAWVSQNGNIPAGAHYSVTSAVSSADVKTLQAVPMPDKAQPYSTDFEGTLPPDSYNPSVLHTYLQLPYDLDPQVIALAKRITANAPTMYGKVIALETYLRSHYAYSVDIQRPPGEEGVSWFLFRSGNKGFCNYFASAMAVMARAVGIPARVAAGYTNGSFDTQQRYWVIKGSNAHAWTQIYFAGYGWINFEPSASFETFTRPQPSQFSSSGAGGINKGSTKGNIPLNQRARGIPGNEGAGDTGVKTTPPGTQAQPALSRGMSLTLGSVALLLLLCVLCFSIWWRRLFQQYSPAIQVYGRICLLASWAGIRLRPAQTPYEYVDAMSLAAPQEAETLKRLADMYVRERWADPQSVEHPQSSEEREELSAIQRKLQPRLFLYVLRRPYILYDFLGRCKQFFGSFRIRRQRSWFEDNDFRLDA